MNKTKQITDLLKEYKQKKDETHNCYDSLSHIVWNEDKQQYWDEPTQKYWDKESLQKELDRRRAEYSKLTDEMYKIENKIKKLFPIEIQNPKEIIACIVSTGYGGKLSSVDINNLVRLPLSVSKEMGTIRTNYKLDFEGYGTFTDTRQYKYRIQRKEGKVYWLFDMYELDNSYIK